MSTTRRISDERLARAFAALGDPQRLRALRFIAAHSEAPLDACEDVCACDIQEHLEVSQSTTSYHTRVLRQAGLVSAEKRGRWIHYRVAEDGIAVLRAFLDEVSDRPSERSQPAA